MQGLACACKDVTLYEESVPEGEARAGVVGMVEGRGRGRGVIDGFITGVHPPPPPTPPPHAYTAPAVLHEGIHNGDSHGGIR